MRRALLPMLALVLLAGCTPPDVLPPTPIQMLIVTENQGWVEVRVTGISTTGYRILWGDVGASYGVSEVLPSQELYSHFYQAVEGEASGAQTPTVYEVLLVDAQGRTVAQASTLVVAAVCHLEPVSLEGRTVTVQYWGRLGIEYSISWGDRFADHVHVDMQTGSGIRTHTYAAPGTYGLGMEEIWAPPQIFFTITVE
jgi:hypothetical protein